MKVLFWFWTEWVDVLNTSITLQSSKENLSASPSSPQVDINAVQLNNMQHALNFILFRGKCAEEPRAFVCLAPYIKVMKMDMMITCANVQNH